MAIAAEMGRSSYFACLKPILIIAAINLDAADVIARAS
jgi:hypothetical protein